MESRPIVPRLHFLYRRYVSGIKKVLEAFLPPTNYIISWSQHHTTHTIQQVSRGTLSLLKLLRGKPKVLILMSYNHQWVFVSAIAKVLFQLVWQYPSDISKSHRPTKPMPARTPSVWWLPSPPVSAIWFSNYHHNRHQPPCTHTFAQ